MVGCIQAVARSPRRLCVVVDLDTWLALDARLLHGVAQLGASEERLGVGCRGKAVDDQQRCWGRPSPGRRSRGSRRPQGIPNRTLSLSRRPQAFARTVSSSAAEINAV